jgi:hypothetical protein
MHTWRCRCEFPNGRVEWIDCDNEAAAHRKAEEIMDTYPGVACFIHPSFVAWARSEGLVPLRPYRSGWLWGHATRH